MANLEQLYTAVISIVASQVGSQLKQVAKDAVGTLGPAIYKDRQNQYKEYPYITVDILSTKENGGWVEDISVNDVDLTEYSFNYQAMFLITCFGNGAQEILTNFKQSLSFEGVRRALHEASGYSATLNRSGNVVESPAFLETDYEDMASMEMTINFRNVVADTTSGIIESAVIESNLLEYEDSPPITNTIIVP